MIDLWLDDDVNLPGLKIAEMIFCRMDRDCRFETGRKDGATVAPGETFATVSGNAQALLTAERVALNLMQRMCGIAVLTARYVHEIEGIGTTLLDSRKTTPGLRMIEKKAVVCVGGRSHRPGLDNGIMLKDNHIAVAGSITAAVKRVRAVAPMLDNMSNADMITAVGIVDQRSSLECSGGVRLETIRAKAETGVDYISVGRITQSATCVDIGLDEV